MIVWRREKQIDPFGTTAESEPTGDSNPFATGVEVVNEGAAATGAGLDDMLDGLQGGDDAPETTTEAVEEVVEAVEEETKVEEAAEAVEAVEDVVNDAAEEVAAVGDDFSGAVETTDGGNDDNDASFDPLAQSGTSGSGMTSAGLASMLAEGESPFAGGPDPYAESAPVDETSKDAIAEWQKEFDARVAKKKAEEEELKAKFKAEAEAEIERMYAERKELMEKTKAANREAETAFIADRDAPVAGKRWEKVVNNVDLKMKTKEEGASRDVSRLRQVLLQSKAFETEASA